MKNVLWGLALVITGSKSIAFTNTGVDNLMWIGGGSLFKTGDLPRHPFSFILVLIVFGIFHVFLTRSALGRQIYCVGGNPEAARLSGIPSKNVLTFVYSLSGFMAGMAGVVSVGRLASANGNAGSTYDTDAIAACIIGGASFTGGKGHHLGHPDRRPADGGHPQRPEPDGRLQRHSVHRHRRRHHSGGHHRRVPEQG